MAPTAWTAGIAGKAGPCLGAGLSGIGWVGVWGWTGSGVGRGAADGSAGSVAAVSASCSTDSSFVFLRPKPNEGSWRERLSSTRGHSIRSTGWRRIVRSLDGSTLRASLR